MALPPPKDCPKIPPVSLQEDHGYNHMLPIGLLPYEVECRILAFMDSKSLRSISATCRHYRVLVQEIAPGLLLGLFPHQRAAVRWMSHREKQNNELDHPNMRFFITSTAKFWGNTSTGEIGDEPPEEVFDFKGGFLCDEAGLGKTVSCISMMLRTKGTLPSPGKDDGSITWFESEIGPRYGYIMVSPHLSLHNRKSGRRNKRLKVSNVEPSEILKEKNSPNGETKESSTSLDLGETDLDFKSCVTEQNQCLWLQCDLCQQWRRLPNTYRPPEGSWCCYLHTVPRMRSCRVTGDYLDDDEEITSLLGWVGELEDPCTEENIDFFRELVHSFDTTFSGVGQIGCRNQNVWLWLASQTAESLSREFVLPGWAAQPPGYGQILKRIGFEPCETSPTEALGTLRAQKKNSQTFNRRPTYFQMDEMSRHDWMRWRKPNNLLQINLDIGALCEALGDIGRNAAVKVFLSPATLVVVPSELVQHWKDQIFWHTRPGTLKATFYDPKSRRKNQKDLAPQVLAWEYDVVITTFSVLSKEWDSLNPIKCSPLSQVYWYRIVIDEGHTLGSVSMTNKLQMVSSLRAECRWVLTGTPSPSSMSSLGSNLRSMQPLLSYLHEPILRTPNRFQELIEKPLRFAPEVAMWRVFCILQRIMVRSSKSDLWNLPRLHKSVKLLEFSSSHANSYNSLIDLVRFNLLTSDWYVNWIV